MEKKLEKINRKLVKWKLNALFVEVIVQLKKSTEQNFVEENKETKNIIWTDTGHCKPQGQSPSHNQK